MEKKYIKIKVNIVDLAEALKNLVKKYEIVHDYEAEKLEEAKEDPNEHDAKEEDDFAEELDDNKPTIEKSDNQAIVKICNVDVPFNIMNNNVYLYKRNLMNLFKIKHQNRMNFSKMDAILEEEGIKKEDAFILHHGRLRKYISIPAVKVLLSREFLVLKNPNLKSELDQALTKLTQDKEGLIAKKCIKLPSFNQIDYKLAKGTVFLKTLQFLKAVGCPQKYIDDNPSRSYFVLIRLLKKRGMNIKECFLKQGICKYGYISIKAGMTLFKMESGPFRNKKKMKLLQKELQNAMKKLPMTKSKNKDQIDIIGDVVSIGNIKVRYMIKDDIMYFHRMTIFEAIGLERALILNSKGLPAINRYFFQIYSGI